MNYKNENDKIREYFSKDFKQMSDLMAKIRNCLISKEPLDISNLNLNGIYDFDPKLSFTYITLFQEGHTPIRFGSLRADLNSTLNRIIEKLRENKNFPEFNLSDCSKCRIMVEFVTEKTLIDPAKLQMRKFNECRFEPGITGFKLQCGTESHYYMPTDAIVQSQMSLNDAISSLTKRAPVKDKKALISSDCKLFLIKSNAFVTFGGSCVPLYRGNILYKDFNYKILLDQFQKSVQWLIDNMYDDGRFLYYYDCKEDNFKDHEHPARKKDDLYYNGLRHSGGTITLIRAHNIFGGDKYLNAARKSLDFLVSITKEQLLPDGQKANYIFYNKKAKLGGTGLALVSFMQYRRITNDKTHDEIIKGYARHLMSRISQSGEFLGYYIHPQYNEGRPLLDPDKATRRKLFSFYYPGEALLGLALFANYFDEDKELVDEVLKKSKIALDWIVDERPLLYKDLFTALPSDGWLMQAIEEWCNNPDFIKDNYLNFVFNDADTMIRKMYGRDDSPYIDYQGGYYYDYGDHYYPDGARSEGLIASYYLAEKLGKTELAGKILNACKKAAACQFQLFNAPQMTYAHKNPARSMHSIRFKATRQWVRVDTVQHVACFFARLYKAEN